MKKDELEITTEKIPDGVKFHLKGLVNSTYADILQNKLEEALRDGKHTIILDMLWVEYLSSTGIRVILKIYKDAKEAGGSLSIERPSQRVRNVLGLTALDEMLIK
jgi:anti-sigma B factor antagonist